MCLFEAVNQTHHDDDNYSDVCHIEIDVGLCWPFAALLLLFVVMATQLSSSGE